MLWQIKDVEYNYNFEAFFPKNSTETAFFKEYRDQFETDNDYILVGLKNNDGVFNHRFLNQVDSLTKALEVTENVELVISPTNVKEFRRYSMHPALVEIPYVHVNDTSQYLKDSLKIFNTYELTNSIFSNHGPVVALILKHKPLLDNEGCLNLTQQVRQATERFQFDEAHLAGRSEGQLVYINLIQRESLIFVGSSMFLLVLFLFIAYRSFWGIWMPLAVVGIVVLWTVGVMTLTGKGIDLLSNIIPTLLMVIGISAVVHLLTHYLTLRREGQSREKALIVAVKEIGFATLLTTLTTMVGFLTLLNSSVQPVADMGLYACIGLVFSFILTYTLFPSLLLIHKPIYKKENEKTKDVWLSFLSKIDQFVQTHYVKIIVVSSISAVLSIGASTLIKKDNYILDGLKENHPSRVDFRFFKDNFSGARPFEMKLWLTDSTASLFDRKVIAQVESLHNYLDSTYGVGSLVSPVSIVKNANRIWYSGKQEKYKVPESDKRLKRLEEDLYRYAKQVNSSAFLNRNHREARVTGKIPDLGSYNMNIRNAEFKKFYFNNVDSNLIKYKMTGSATLMDVNTTFIAQNVIEGLVIAILLIGFLVGFLFRSVKMAFVSLVPNVFPLLICAAIMGIFSIDFNLSTSIIFIIAFGIAVDDSIHFLARLKQELKINDGDLSKSMSGTFATTGKAIIVTTLILSGGFLTLCLSDFSGTFYIGLLICITLLVAVISDLLLLPAVILLVSKKKG